MLGFLKSCTNPHGIWNGFEDQREGSLRFRAAAEPGTEPGDPVLAGSSTLKGRADLPDFDKKQNNNFTLKPRWCVMYFYSMYIPSGSG